MTGPIGSAAVPTTAATAQTTSATLTRFHSTWDIEIKARVEESISILSHGLLGTDGLTTEQAAEAVILLLGWVQIHAKAVSV